MSQHAQREVDLHLAEAVALVVFLCPEDEAHHLAEAVARSPEVLMASLPPLVAGDH